MISVNSRFCRISVIFTAILLLSILAVIWSHDGEVEAADRRPILIRSDSDFIANNGVVSGTGSEENPYIISNWSIVNSGNCIQISGTTKYFVVRDITVSYSGSSRGVWLFDLSNGLIENVTLKGGGFHTRFFTLDDVNNLTIRNVTAVSQWTLYAESCVDLLFEDVSFIDEGYMINLYNCERCTLVRCHVANNSFRPGFYIEDSVDISLRNCTARSCEFGISIRSSDHTSVIGCIFEDNAKGDLLTYSYSYYTRINQTHFSSAGIVLSTYRFDEIDSASTVDGKPIALHVNETDVVVDPTAGQVILYNCTNVRISNVTTNGTRRPISIEYCDGVLFENLDILNSYDSIVSWNCRNMTIKDSSFEYSVFSTTESVRIRNVENLTIDNVIIKGKGDGLSISGTNYKPNPSYVRLSNITSTVIDGTAINVVSANTTIIEGCLFINCTDIGLELGYCIDVDVSNCTFIDCRVGIDSKGPGLYAIHDNNVMNGSVGFSIRSDNTTVNGNLIEGASSGIRFPNAKNANVSSNMISRCITGIYIGSIGLVASNNTIEDCRFGLILSGQNNTIIDCTVSNSSDYGIQVNGDEHDIVSCVLSNATNAGIIIYSSSEFINITDCLFDGSLYGLEILNSQATIYLNRFVNNTGYAITTTGSFNRIYWNTFETNNYDHAQSMYIGPQAYSKYTDYYDNGKEGNIWGDYLSRYPSATIIDGKIWDTAYLVAGGSDDNFPLATSVDLVAPDAVAGDDVTVPQNSTVTFNGMGSFDNMGIYRFDWTFVYMGEVTKLHQGVANFTFDKPGVYPVTLTVWDRFGNSDLDVLRVTVIDTEPPVPVVGDPIIVDMGVAFELNGSSSRDNVGILSFKWTLDPGGLNVVSDFTSFNYVIDTPGEYIAVLNVSDALGNWALGSLNITVLDIEPPIADAGEDIEVDQGVETTFNGSGSSDNVGIVAYLWTIRIGDDVVTLNGSGPSYTFREPGIFNVTLTVTDGRGLSYSDELVVTVHDTEPPIASAGDDVTINEGGTAILNGLGSTDNVGIVSFVWSYMIDERTFEDTGKEVDLSFQDPGTYNVVLRVEDARGNWGEDMVLVIVNDITRPTADAGGDRTIAQSEALVLDGGNSTDNAGIVQYEWEIEDVDGTTTLDGRSVTYTFDSPGVFQVTLTVTDDADLMDMTTIRVTVVDISPPMADAGDDTTFVVRSTHQLDGSGSTDNVAITRYKWTFTYKGEAKELSGARPSFFFDKAGSYEIELEVEDGAGNLASDSTWVTVKPEIVPWEIGPFVGPDGKPVKGAKVAIRLAGSEYETRTDDRGWAIFEVKWVDLQSPVNVTFSKSSWKRQTFDIDLDEEGNPTGEIPVMNRKKADESPSAGAALVVMAILASLVVFRRGRKK